MHATKAVLTDSKLNEDFEHADYSYTRPAGQFFLAAALNCGHLYPKHATLLSWNNRIQRRYLLTPSKKQLLFLRLNAADGKRKVT